MIADMLVILIWTVILVGLDTPLWVGLPAGIALGIGLAELRKGRRAPGSAKPPEPFDPNKREP